MTPTRRDAACMGRGVSIIGVSTSFSDANDQSDKSYRHLLSEHLLGLENDITAVYCCKSRTYPHGRLKSLPLINMLVVSESQDVVFLINGQMFSCKGSLEHVVQVRKDGQGNAVSCIERTMSLLYCFLCV